jgi:hypothetical protein
MVIVCSGLHFEYGSVRSHKSRTGDEVEGAQASLVARISRVRKGQESSVK